MTRREFTTLLGGAAAAWPLAARAQQPSKPVIGFMSSRSPEDSVNVLTAFRRGLGEGGLIEGENVAIDFRWARGAYQEFTRTGSRTCQPPGGHTRGGWW